MIDTGFLILRHLTLVKCRRVVWHLPALDACQETINVLPCGGRSSKRCHHSH